MMEIHPKISQEKLSATLQQSTTKKILGSNKCCNKNWINCHCIFKYFVCIFIYQVYHIYLQRYKHVHVMNLFYIIVTKNW